VIALEKAIEHMIYLHLSAKHFGHTPTKLQVEAYDKVPWNMSIKYMLTCLASLESTVSGLYITNSAFQPLMRKYGDILMECWSPDDKLTDGTEDCSCPSRDD
jgi:hypothetical protein